MLRTLITGHTLDLTDIVSVGPIMQSSKGVQGSIYRRWLHFDIHCKHNVTLHHEDYMQEVIYEPDPALNQAWQKQFEQLKQKREDLIELWEKARSGDEPT